MVDRRYSQGRFYSGSRASNDRAVASERLVRSYLERARAINRSAQTYGGSTGGISSAGGGVAVIAERGANIKDAREIFRAEGSGAFGGRASVAEIRGFRQPRNLSAAPVAAG